MTLFIWYDEIEGDNKKFMKISSIKRMKGFTLVELLVVIGILSIMIAALVATIDPFEQIKKAQDANLKNMASEFVSANERYYTQRNGLPWYSTTENGANCYSNGNTLSNIKLNALNTCLSTLASSGELKQSFVNSNSLSQLIVNSPNPQTGSQTSIVVCFLPQSKAQQKDVVTKYNQDGSTGNNCKSTGGQANCHWCAFAE